jgi:gamma-glutamyl hydrolase
MRFHNATLNWHRQGLLIETYESNPHLKAQMSALATTRTPSGRHTFVAAAEDRSGAAIYGIQFHPERPPFEFTRDQIGHTPRDIAVSHYFGRFITEGLRANNHSFPSPQDAEALRVAQWPLEDLGWGMRTYFVKDPLGSQRV